MQNVWMITGASGGLGKGIAEAALHRGDAVALTSRSPAKLNALAAEFPKQAMTVKLELDRIGSMEKALHQVYARFGRIDVLVNNAGHGYRAAIEESEPTQVRELFETDFFAPMRLIQLALPGMRARHSGMIINVSSIGAVRGALGNGYYSAAKGALELASEALAKETAHLGIRVMLVEPGAFRTAFYGSELKESEMRILDYDALAQHYRKQTVRHDQLGDPAKGGAIIVDTALRQDAPLRLILGSDALQAAQMTLQGRLDELRTWQEISKKSDHEDHIQ